MWIISKTGFVSLVEHDQDPTKLRARARRAEHLTGTFNADVIDLGPDCPDYRYHADVDRDAAAAAIANAVLDIEYTSHVKEHVAGNDHVFYSAMLGAWRELHRLQDQPTPTLDDLTDLVGQIDELADKMRGVDPTRDKQPDQTWDESAPLPVTTVTAAWLLDDDVDQDYRVCDICGDDFEEGDQIVAFPEDDRYGPAANAHAKCAADEGWTVIAS